MSQLLQYTNRFDFKTNIYASLNRDPQTASKLPLIPFEKMLAIDETWSFEKLTVKEISDNTHIYHRYPAKFIPPLARKLIEKYSKEGDMVCDPFMGCGTTLVESLVCGRKATGVDINPVACLITRAKTTPKRPINLEKNVQDLLSKLSSYFEAHKEDKTFKPGNKYIMPENERINYWFPNENIRNELCVLLGHINKIKNKDFKNFCLCAFSNILKNSSIWLTKSIKPTRDLEKDPSMPYTAFSKQIKLMQTGNDKLYNMLLGKVRTNLKEYVVAKKRDARKIPCEANSVDLIVTSPPYVTSYEYADIHQLTALWLDYAKNVTEFRAGFIGSIHRRELRHDGIKSILAKQEIDKLAEKSKHHAEAVRNYFFEMQQCFEEMHRVLRSGGKACIVIGNTELKKVPILNAEAFVEIMLNMGFKLKEIVKRRIFSKSLPQTRDSKTGRFASKDKADRLAYAHEYILVMEKP